MTPTILVIIGITGDLAKRKLLPAIEAISRAAALSEHFVILGTTRQKGITPIPVEGDFVQKHMRILSLDTDSLEGYASLRDALLGIEKEFGAPAQRLFYLSVPPRAVPTIIEHLGASGLMKVPQTKLLLEKPFGTDLESAKDLVAHIDQHASPEQVYRIDHYLAKHMVQNLLIFREYNSLFRRSWNNQFIDRIEIVAYESIDIEGRAHFYEQTGALRDIVQSHLLQLVALTLMQPTSPEQMQDIPDERLKVLQSLRLLGTPRRGQYEGYREEVRNRESVVETYVDLTLESTDPHFTGVPIRLVTGKALTEKLTEIRIYYKKDHQGEANELILRLQPDEGVSMKIWTRRPGYEDVREEKTLDFTYADHYATVPDAYEQVLFDAMRGDHDLSIGSREVLESWRIITPVQEAWAKSSDDLFFYKKGETPFTSPRLC